MTYQGEDEVFAVVREPWPAPATDEELARRCIEVARLIEVFGISVADLVRWSEGPGVGSYRVTGDYRLGARAVA